MEFKVGQIWKDGEGKLYTITNIFNPSMAYYPVVAEDHIEETKRTYTEKGRYVGDNTPCEMDLVELVKDADDEPEQEPSDETVLPQAEPSGKMLDEGGERALFDVLVVQSVVTGLIERKGIKRTLAGIRAIIEARRAL